MVDFQSIKKRTHPKKIKATLRTYQHNGYEWLHFLHDNRIGGILADDTGLGKTVQTLALLHDIYIHQKQKKPTLLVLPTSLIFNWKDEIAKFTPNLKYYDSTGIDRDIEYIKKQSQANEPDFHLVMTTYGTLLRDVNELAKINWYYVILDESQQIKNFQSLTHKAALTLKSGHRLSLTGTPLENNLEELWAQFAFINPGMLGGREFFRSTFSLPIQNQKNKIQAEKLKKLVYPFIMRRLKKDVACDLIEKVETTLYMEPQPAQKKLYDSVKNFYRMEVMKAIDEEGLNKSRFKVLEALLRLRQICCHPKLVDPKHSASSAKLEVLLENVLEAVEEGHKVLVFSQFTSMLELIAEELIKQDIDFSYLDGSTRNRERVVKEFQTNKKKQIFLISLKAGGVGLNLTQADYVFHYDPWWNPAVEQQATDRTHRIGQDKKVFNYKLIMKGTVEEKILSLQQKKKDLVENIISVDESLTKHLTRDDIENLFT